MVRSIILRNFLIFSTACFTLNSLNLKLGFPIILLRNLTHKGYVMGRVANQSMHNHIIGANILTGSAAEEFDRPNDSHRFTVSI